MSKRDHQSDDENDDGDAGEVTNKKQKRDPRLQRCIEIDRRASALARHNVDNKARIQFTLTLFEVDPTNGKRVEVITIVKVSPLNNNVYETVKIPPLQDGSFYLTTLLVCLLFPGGNTRVHEWQSGLIQFVAKMGALELKLGDKVENSDSCHWTVQINRDGNEFEFFHYASQARRLIANFRDEFIELDSERVLRIVLAEAALAKPELESVPVVVNQ